MPKVQAWEILWAMIDFKWLRRPFSSHQVIKFSCWIVMILLQQRIRIVETLQHRTSRTTSSRRKTEGFNRLWEKTRNSWRLIQTISSATFRPWKMMNRNISNWNSSLYVSPWARHLRVLQTKMYMQVVQHWIRAKWTSSLSKFKAKAITVQTRPTFTKGVLANKLTSTRLLVNWSNIKSLSTIMRSEETKLMSTKCLCSNLRLWARTA